MIYIPPDRLDDAFRKGFWTGWFTGMAFSGVALALVVLVVWMRLAMRTW